MSHIHKGAAGWDAWGKSEQEQRPSANIDLSEYKSGRTPLFEKAVVENVPNPEDALVKLKEAFIAAGFSEQQATQMARDTINHRPQIQKELDAESKQLSVEELEPPTQPAAPDPTETQEPEDETAQAQ